MILSAKNISKSYESLSVLKNVSLDIDKGSFVAIVGASGAGKSSLLHIIGTLDQPDSGSVFMYNKNLFEMSAKEQAAFRNQKMGFVFQFHHLLPEFTALENVCMPLWIGGASRKQAEQKAKEVLDRVGMSHRIAHKPSQMSGGEQQRVAIARALVQGPEIVFADEPTGNLDTENAAAVHLLFKELQKEMCLTIVVVTHNNELAQIADRVITMKDGEILNVEKQGL